MKSFRAYGPARLPLRVFAALALVAALFLSGCATRPTAKATVAAAAKVAEARRIVIAPIDAELSELTAGGMLEPRLEWTEAATRNLVAAVSEKMGIDQASLADAPLEAAAELEEVQALIRTFALHRLGTAVGGAADPFAGNNAALTYHTGEFAKLADAADADVVLFVFIRDSFASAGRKSLMALSVVGAALTGVAVVPQMGSTVMAAALVHRDGTVVWFNHSLGGHDPRTPEGARALIDALLKDVPAKGRAT